MIPARTDEALNVVVESPRGSSAKFKRDPKSGLMTLSRQLPSGLVYPYDWGFIPGTSSDDGDPLDAMVYWDSSSYPGVVIPCRAVALLKLDQVLRSSGERQRNDRVLAVPLKASRFDSVRGVDDVPERVRVEIEFFFKCSIAFESKDIVRLEWSDANAADRLIADAIRR